MHSRTGTAAAATGMDAPRGTQKGGNSPDTFLYFFTGLVIAGEVSTGVSVPTKAIRDTRNNT